MRDEFNIMKLRETGLSGMLEVPFTEDDLLFDEF